MTLVTKGGAGLFERAQYYEVPNGSHVYSWSPDPEPGRTPATQVHLHFGEPPGTVFVVRFKSPRTLGALLHALREHRDFVWPDRCKTCDGAGALLEAVPEGREAPICGVCEGRGVP